MNPLGNYIMERIKIDNIKTEYNFSEPIKLGNIKWQFPTNDGDMVYVDVTGDWYAGVVYDKRNHDNDILIFWSKNSTYIPYIFGGTTKKCSPKKLPWCVVALNGTEKIDNNFYNYISGNIHRLWEDAYSIYHPKEQMGAPDIVNDITEAWKKTL